MVSSTSSAPGRLTTDHLADLTTPNDVRISPDGQRVVYSASTFTHKGDHPTSSLWLADVGVEHSARQLTSGLHNDTAPCWAPDSTAIAFISDRGGKLGETSAVHLIRTDGGEAYAITPAEHKRAIARIAWSPSGTFVAFTSADEKTGEQLRREKEKDDVVVYGEEWEYARLRIVHVQTRQVTTLVSREAHVDLFSWSRDSSAITYVLHLTPDLNSRGNHGVELERISLVDKKTIALFHFPGPIRDLVCAQTDTYFIAGVKTDSNTTAQAVYRASRDDHVGQTSYSKYAFGDTNTAEKLLWTGNGVAALVQSGLYDEVHLLDDGQIIYHDLQQIFTVDVLSRPSADTILVLGTSSATRPIEIFTRTSTSKTPTCLSTHGATIQNLKLPYTHEPIYATAPDGHPCDGVLCLPSPSSSPPAPLPTIVHIHGGPYYRSSLSFSPTHYLEAPWLLSAGYAVLSPNYRGNSSHGEAHAAAARGGMGGVEFADVLSLLRAAIEKGVVDESRVAIGGWSQGGFLSYWAAVTAGTDSGFPFRGAVCGAGVVDWDMLTLTSDAWWFEEQLAGRSPWTLSPSSSSKANGEEDPAPGRKGSAIWHMARAKAEGRPMMPVLLLHGEKDVRVPASQAEAFRRACEQLGWPCEMAVYPREGHLMWERNHIVDMWTRMRRFYDVCLAREG